MNFAFWLKRNKKKKKHIEYIRMTRVFMSFREDYACKSLVCGVWLFLRIYKRATRVTFSLVEYSCYTLLESITGVFPFSRTRDVLGYIVYTSDFPTPIVIAGSLAFTHTVWCICYIYLYTYISLWMRAGAYIYYLFHSYIRICVFFVTGSSPLYIARVLNGHKSKRQSALCFCHFYRFFSYWIKKVRELPTSVPARTPFSACWAVSNILLCFSFLIIKNNKILSKNSIFYMNFVW